MSKRLRKPGAVQETRPAERTLTTREMAEFLATIPELSEAFTSAELELALDDRGWVTGAFGKANAAELDGQSRMVAVQKSRTYWQRDPLAKQAVRLWTDYSVGTGISYKADDDSTQQTLSEFMSARRNRKFTSKLGQQRLSKKLLVDGDLFLLVFGAAGEKKTVRTMDPQQVMELVSDPEDEETVLAFKRKTKDDKIKYYRAWDADPADLAGLVDSEKKSVAAEDGVVCYHVAFDQMGLRGNGLLFSVVDWSREHRKFMEARVAITQALAKYAWKTEVKGGQAVVNQVKAKLESSFSVNGTSGGAERNPATAPASTFIGNAGINTTPMPRVTGAQDAREDSNSLKLMFCAGTGIMLHYLGDPSTGNLATATAMELPMKKQFEGYQELWKSVWRDVFAIAADEDPEQEDQDQITIDLPQILAADLTGKGTFLTQLTTAFPEAKVDAVLQSCLTDMGIEDVDVVMKDIEDKRQELQQKAEQDAQQQHQNALALKGMDPNAVQQAAGAMNQAAGALKEALELADGLERGAAKSRKAS
jgi:hypothetical protein